MRPKNQLTGALRHRCTIQKPTETVDAAGQPIVSWTAYVVDEPCQFTPTAGIESMRGRQLEAGTRAVFRVRYRSGYTVQMRVVYQGETYGITAVNMVDGLRNYMDIICAAVLP